MNIAVDAPFPVVEINLIVVVGGTEQQCDNIICIVKYDSADRGTNTCLEECIKMESANTNGNDYRRKAICCHQDRMTQRKRLPQADVQHHQNSLCKCEGKGNYKLVARQVAF